MNNWIEAVGTDYTTRGGETVRIVGAQVTAALAHDNKGNETKVVETTVRATLSSGRDAGLPVCYDGEGYVQFPGRTNPQEPLDLMGAVRTGKR